MLTASKVITTGQAVDIREEDVCLLQSSGGGPFRGVDGGTDKRGGSDKTSDSWRDVAGWVTLIGLGFDVVTLSRNSATVAAPPPPMPMK